MPILQTRGDGSSSKDSSNIIVFTMLGVIVFAAVTALFVKYVARRVVASRSIHRKGPSFVLVNASTRARRDTLDDTQSEKTRIEKELVQANAYSRDISKDEPAIFLREVTPTPSHHSLHPTTDLLDEMPTLAGKNSRSNTPHSGLGPFSFALRTASAASRETPSRASQSSMGASSYRTAHSRLSMTPSAAEMGAVRTVQQTFASMLQDELGLTQLGEKVFLVESFDDGWCLVTRETTAAEQGLLDSAASAVRTFFKPARDEEDDQERKQLDLGKTVGFVPSWCFVEPAPGLKPQRPMRCSSLPASAVQL